MKKIKWLIIIIIICTLYYFRGNFINLIKNQEFRLTQNSLLNELEIEENLEIEKFTCSDEICSKYLEIWKKEQMYQNNYDENYFNEHIIPVSAEVFEWMEGESFSVIYYVSIDWAKAKALDSFMIRTKPESRLFPALNIKRGEYLSQEEIRRVVDKFAFNSQITKFNPVEELTYKTKTSAISAIKTKSLLRLKKVEILPEIDFSPSYKSMKNIPGAFIKAKRELYLVGVDMSDCSTLNMATEIKLNLVTGKIEKEKGVCVVD